MVLDRNPSNYFAEIEQLAFAPSHLIPGECHGRQGTIWVISVIGVMWVIGVTGVVGVIGVMVAFLLRLFVIDGIIPQ